MLLLLSYTLAGNFGSNSVHLLNHTALLRLLMFPVLAWAGFVAYGYSLDFFTTAIPTPKDRSLIFGVLLAQGFTAAALVSVLFCYPLAFIYRKSAATTAFVMALPVLALRLPELTAFDRHPIALAISAYEVFAYAVLLVAGAELAHRHLARSNIAVKRDAPLTLTLGCFRCLGTLSVRSITSGSKTTAQMSLKNGSFATTQIREALVGIVGKDIDYVQLRIALADELRHESPCKEPQC